jgi:hypothetical protein
LNIGYVCATIKNIKMQKVGLLGFNGQIEELLGSIIGSSNFTITGIYIPETTELKSIKDEFQLPLYKNPFGLIAESDLLIVSKTDENSYNLIIECIQNSRNILISNPENLTLDEIEYLNKLSCEASVNAYPVISFKLKYFIREFKNFPLNPRLIRIKSTGKNIIINSLPVGQFSMYLADLVTSIIDVPIKKINAQSTFIIDGVYPYTTSTILFEGGRIANIEIDTFSENESFIIEVYDRNKIIEIDLLNDSMKCTNIGGNCRNSAISEHIFDNFDLSFQRLIEFATCKDDRGIAINHLAGFKNTLSIYKKIREKLMLSTAN